MNHDQFLNAIWFATFLSSLVVMWVGTRLMKKICVRSNLLGGLLVALGYLVIIAQSWLVGQAR